MYTNAAVTLTPVPFYDTTTAIVRKILALIASHPQLREHTLAKSEPAKKHQGNERTLPTA
jgi:hypothetical protein